MAKCQSIPPFPDNIDRNAFGYWLSGFSDGEGCFHLGQYTRLNIYIHYYASFTIKLRSDDDKILYIVQSFLQCGHINYIRRNDDISKNPFVNYACSHIEDLRRTIVPNFEKFPLMAKKKQDFEIWKEGVKLMSSVQNRPLVFGERGWPRWSNNERDNFIDLVVALKETRKHPNKKNSTVSSIEINKTSTETQNVMNFKD